MKDVVILLLPVFGVIVGVTIQHVLSKSKQRADQLEVYRQESYADYLRCVANLVDNRSENHNADRAGLADAKTRMAIFGSTSVLRKLAEIEKSGANLAQEESIDIFTNMVVEMRRETRSGKLDVDPEVVRLILFNKH